jgi:hypothetical protein
MNDAVWTNVNSIYCANIKGLDVELWRVMDKWYWVVFDTQGTHIYHGVDDTLDQAMRTIPLIIP